VSQVESKSESNSAGHESESDWSETRPSSRPKSHLCCWVTHVKVIND